MLFVKVFRLPLNVRRAFPTFYSQRISPACISQAAARHFSQQNDEKQQSTVEVYVGPLSKQIRRLKLFSLVTSISGLMAQPVIIQKAAEINASFGAVAVLTGFVGFCTFGTPILIHSITRKYVTSLDYHPEDDSYTAKVYTLFLQVHKIPFKTRDVKIPETGGFMSTFLAKDRPLFVDARYFSDLSHYKKIMGYDKPLKFEFDDEEDPKTKS